MNKYIFLIRCSEKIGKNRSRQTSVERIIIVRKCRKINTLLASVAGATATYGVGSSPTCRKMKLSFNHHFENWIIIKFQQAITSSLHFGSRRRNAVPSASHYIFYTEFGSVFYSLILFYIFLSFGVHKHFTFLLKTCFNWNLCRNERRLIQARRPIFASHALKW